nr:DNA repair protein XRCC2 isoform X2 [Rattus norvegicus]
MCSDFRRAESGTELLARLEGRSSLKELEPSLFADEDSPVHEWEWRWSCWEACLRLLLSKLSIVGLSEVAKGACLRRRDKFAQLSQDTLAFIRCTSPEPFYQRPHHPRTAALRTEQEDMDSVRPPSTKTAWGGSSRKALQPGALAPRNA